VERLLTKSRVLICLCVVLLLAALNRQDPMVYGMFLFLVVISMLGFVLPWLSLRATTVRLDVATDNEVMEGTECQLNLLVEHAIPWPAFMVDIETEWEWASQRIVLKQTVPVIRAGRAPDLAGLIKFPCRGHYELIAVRLASGFPLGLVRASHTLSRPQIHMRVYPSAQPVRWPLQWDITQDSQDELTTRRVGQSFELGLLRPYCQGEPVGRVNWRASARVGKLVIQHFQENGAVRLHVAVEVPRGTSLGDSAGMGEQAIRLAAGVCHAALNHRAQLLLYLEHLAKPVCDASAILAALSEAEPCAGGFFPTIARVANATKQGEQVAVVISSTGALPALMRALGGLASRGCRVVVFIAMGRRTSPLELSQAMALQQELQQAGFATLLEAP
jgi:uncharacterized protein (DUF58 family)